MKKYNFKLITPEKIAYDSDVDSMSVMTESGQITVYANHERLVTVIVPGELTVIKDGVEFVFAVGQGALSINNNHVELLVNTTESVTDIDEARAREAIDRARALMEMQADEVDLDYARIEALIARNLARIKVKNR